MGEGEHCDAVHLLRHRLTHAPQAHLGEFSSAGIGCIRFVRVTKAVTKDCQSTQGECTQNYVAIKIVRNIDKYRHAAMIEVRVCASMHACIRVALIHGMHLQLEVLNTLETNDPEGVK